MKVTDSEIALTSEGVAFAFTNREFDLILEALEDVRDDIGSGMDGNSPAKDPEDWADQCERFALFHRMLGDLKKRRGKR